MLRKSAHDVKLCPRCYLRGRLQRLYGSTRALLCLGCGRVYTLSDYNRARCRVYLDLSSRQYRIANKENHDVGTAAAI